MESHHEVGRKGEIVKLAPPFGADPRAQIKGCREQEHQVKRENTDAYPEWFIGAREGNQQVGQRVSVVAVKEQ